MDIAVCVDCSSSITSYFDHVRLSILSTFNEILAEHQNDVRIALIEFQSHTDSWVTNIHPFTSSMNLFHEWFDAIRTDGKNTNQCKAVGKMIKKFHFTENKIPFFYILVDALDASRTLEWRSIVSNRFTPNFFCI